VPTSLVGQVDAAIGGKTAINVAAKNDVGAFHLPERVVADPDLLGSLPERGWSEGFAEAVKTGLLAGGPLWELVRRSDGTAADATTRTELVRRCAAYKTAVVVADPEERGVRAVLNLGHTIGHGLEAAAGFDRLGHGQAVAVGLSAALWLSVRLRGLAPAVLEETEAALDRAGLPLRAPGLDPDDVLAAMRGDKKRVGGRLRFVLLEAVGQPVVGVDVADDHVRAAVERAVRPPEGPRPRR
jgi:3-dehydroquinate synthetase